MKYGALPSIDRPVSRLILGTDWMRYKKLFLFPNRRRKEQIFSLLNRAWEAGINAFDGARVYFSEETLGEWIKELNNRDSLILISKGAHPNLITGKPRLSPSSISADLRNSLRRLGTNTIDVYLLHYDDVCSPVGPLMERLNAHFRNGEIRSLGVSNWSVERIQEANLYCKEKGLEPFRVASPQFSVFEWNRPPWPNAISLSGEKGTHSRHWLQTQGIPVIAWSPLGRGYLERSEKSEGGRGAKRQGFESVYDSLENRARRERIQNLSLLHGVPRSAVALAGILQQELHPFAVIGPKTIDQLEQCLKSLSFVLSDKEIRQLIDPLPKFMNDSKATGI
jgi:aryl-alcohol dehydrogenase-like predicted oxidoreductase